MLKKRRFLFWLVVRVIWRDLSLLRKGISFWMNFGWICFLRLVRRVGMGFLRCLRKVPGRFFVVRWGLGSWGRIWRRGRGLVWGRGRRGGRRRRGRSVVNFFYFFIFGFFWFFWFLLVFFGFFLVFFCFLSFFYNFFFFLLFYL